MVLLAWFLVARFAHERQERDAQLRNEELMTLRNSEIVATRMGTWMARMAMAERGFVLTGNEELLRPLESSRRSFNADVALLIEREQGHVQIQDDVRRLKERVDLWHDWIVAPNLALRRRGGLAAFSAGTDGAERVLHGARVMDGARALHDIVLSDIRDHVREAEVIAGEADAQDAYETFLIRAGAVAIFLLAGTLLLRRVSGDLTQVVTAAKALESGRYAAARLPDWHRPPNREMGALGRTFEQLAESIETRERQLQEDIVKLRELERLKADFVSTVSHELRTPLTSMRGALGLMLAGKVVESPGKQRELLQIAMSNTERLIRLINDILDIEKMDAGQVVVRRDRLHLRPVVTTALKGLEVFARDAKVRLSFETGIDAEVIGDSDRLVQVLTNLVSNAVKFSPEGSTVELKMVPVGDSVSVQVRDHGNGIPEEFRTRIFGRFQQAGGADSRRSGGTGLGLSIAKSIVDLHGGRIGFEDAPEGGTTFWFTLPTVAPIVAKTSEPVGVLIIEDDPSMRDVLVALFEPLCRPLAVPSAEAALAQLEYQTVGAIVLDPGLPGMHGLDFARRLRSDPRLRTLPIFILSAKEFSTEELRAAGVRATDAFVKTRDSEDALYSRLAAELRRAR